MRRSTVPSRSNASGSRGASGFTMAELVVSVALSGLLMATTTFAWATYHHKTRLTATVNTTKLALNQARLQAIFQNVNHYVVVDPDGHEVQIYRDDSAPLGEFNNGDSLQSVTRWPPAIELSLPASGSIPDPLSGDTLTEAWSLPESTDHGMALRVNPMGKIMSTGETSQIVGNGTIVFNDVRGGTGTASVNLQGQSGSINTYRLTGSSWVRY